MRTDQEAASDAAVWGAISRSSTLAEQLVAALEAQITSNQLPPGTRLPPERELAQRFGVSRTVVREALRHLSAKSWLQMVPGGGAIVSVPTREHLSQSMTLLLRAGEWNVPHAHVLEVRRMLETQVTELAAARRDERDIARLETLLEAMRALVGTQRDDDLEAIMQNDVDFHAALAEATHNPLVPVLLHSVADILLAVRRLGMRDVSSHRNALFFHSEILDAVKNGDANAARAAMEAHLDESEATMRRAALALEKSSPEKPLGAAKTDEHTTNENTTNENTTA